MHKSTLKDFKGFLQILQEIDRGTVTLFRGQDCLQPLLPKIARARSHSDSTVLESEMLKEVRRRGGLYIDQPALDDWDLLVYVQHFGMATRLLDWTSNPLVALWFACERYGADGSTYFYVLITDKSALLDRKTDPSPFDRSRTKILKPNLNNPRIVAQNGWFTAHKYSVTAKKFVPLEQNPEFRDALAELRVPNELHKSLLERLDVLGVNHQSIFPDFEGLCRYVNWLHL